jgi:hypothetical protein
VIVYRAVPYLVVVAPPVIVLLSVLVGGCTMTRPVDELIDQARFHSGPNSRAGEELIMSSIGAQRAKSCGASSGRRSDDL